MLDKMVLYVPPETCVSNFKEVVCWWGNKDLQQSFQSSGVLLPLDVFVFLALKTIQQKNNEKNDNKHFRNSKTL